MRSLKTAAVGLLVAALTLSAPGVALAAPGDGRGDGGVVARTRTAAPKTGESRTAAPKTGESRPAAPQTPTPTPTPTPERSASPSPRPNPTRTAEPTPTPQATPTLEQKALGGAAGTAISALRQQNPWLGQPKNDGEQVAGGYVQEYANGTIYWSQQTGAHFMKGLILQRYLSVGGPARMGFPSTNEVDGPRGSKTNTTTAGALYWTPTTGAHAVLGDIFKNFDQHGGASGDLGLPTSDEFPAGRGALAQRFQNGLALWTPRNGARIVQGRILDEYAKLGFERGVLGLPVTDEHTAAGARVSRFQNGAIYWTPQTGAAAIYGDNYKRYAAMGYERSVLGVPTSSEFSGAKGTRVNRFGNGALIMWTPTYGSHAIYGKIVQRYASLGWERGPLGVVRSDEFSAGHGVRVSQFTGGTIYWHPTTGRDANAVYGEIFKEYRDQRYENGPLGMPTSSEFSGRNGARVNRFQNGLIIWTPRTGAWTVRGALLQEFARHGFEGGDLGAPKSNEWRTANGWAQDFEKGRLFFEGGRFRVERPLDVDPRCMTGRVLCISKGDNKMRWMIDGEVIKTFDARFGKLSTPTREGEFHVFRKVRDEVSWMYGNTPMPFAMYFSGGEAVHYSYDFAARGYAGASHGCVNIRDYDGIKWLYDTQVKIGDKVVVYW